MSNATRALLAGLVDYAGLFPPAALPMAEAAANYAAYRRSPERWMLARFVVPAGRLGDLAATVERLPAALRGEGPWELAVLVGDNAAGDLQEALAVDARTAPLFAVRAVETTATTAARIADLRALVPPRLELYCELPLGRELCDLVAAVREAGAAAKVRTGGVTAGAFPSPSGLLAFLEACAEARVAFKATAGLHHPVRGEAPLTYEPDAACATMFGHLNVVLAAAALWGGRPRAEAAALLECADRGSLSLTPETVRWGASRFSAAELTAARTAFVRGIGSCSFSEPVAELVHLGADLDGAGAEGR